MDQKATAPSTTRKPRAHKPKAPDKVEVVKVKVDGESQDEAVGEKKTQETTPSLPRSFPTSSAALAFAANRKIEILRSRDEQISSCGTASSERLAPAIKERDDERAALAKIYADRRSRLVAEEAQALKAARQRVENEFKAKRDELEDIVAKRRTEINAPSTKLMAEVNVEYQEKVAEIRKRAADELSALDTWHKEVVLPLQEKERLAREAAKQQAVETTKQQAAMVSGQESPPETPQAAVMSGQESPPEAAQAT